MTEELRQWPLIEVIAEFHLPMQTWTDDLPELLFARLKDVLPVRRTVVAFKAELTFGPGQRGQSAEDYKRHQFLTRDETKLVQIDRHILTINHLRPYTCWEEYEPLINRTLSTYESLRGAAGFSSVALQYINRIEISGLPIDIADYFEFFPKFDGEFVNCGCMAVQPWPEEMSTINRQMQTQPLQGDCLPVVLILSAKRDNTELAHVSSWVNAAHSKLDSVFKSSITDKTRELFACAKSEA